MATQKQQSADTKPKTGLPAGTKITPVQQVCEQLSRMTNHFQQALPEDVSVDRFTRVVMTAVQQNPDIAAVEDKQGLYNACVRAAQDGLLPNGVEGALVVFNKNFGTREKPDYKKSVQWMPMVAGLIKRMAKVGIRIEANVVYQKELEQGLFKYTLGDNPNIEHQPMLVGDRGAMIGAYMVATLADGSRVRTFMRADEIQKVRNASKTGKFGPWADWEEEMSIKTVIRRGYKRLPIDDSDRWGKAAVSAITSDDENYQFADPANILPSQSQGAAVGTATRSESMQKAIDSTGNQAQQKTGQTIEHNAGTQQSGDPGNQGQGSQAAGGAPSDILD